jgi:nucleoside-diphosphate-sugar epimerase
MLSAVFFTPVAVNYIALRVFYGKFVLKPKIMQTILGAGGTIGKLLAKELIQYTDKIRLVSRKPEKVNKSDELFAADLLQPGTADKAVEGSEVVYLVVGLEYKAGIWEQQWPVIMRETVDACIRHKARLVFFDNVYLYDKDYISGMTEETPVNPSSRKGAVRKKILETLFEAVDSGRLSALVARSADFYGPDNGANFITQMVLKNLSLGKKPMWFVSPDIQHSFTYTRDAARATALLGNTPDAYGQVWHLPTDNRPVTGRQIINMIASEYGVQPKISILPKWMLGPLGLFIPVMREMPEMMYQYDRKYFFDSSKFTGRFGIPATSYEQGVKETCKAYRAQENILPAR